MVDANDSPVAAWKRWVAIGTAVIAALSLVLNVVQWRADKQTADFELRAQYPTINTFRIALTSADVGRIESLVNGGATFSYITNPAFLNFDAIDGLGDDSRILFLVVTNTGEIAATNLRLEAADASGAALSASVLEAGSTLLVPQGVSGEPVGSRVVVPEIATVSYDFAVGGNRLSDTVPVTPMADGTLVFEVGLGPIIRSGFDFGD